MADRSDYREQEALLWEDAKTLNAVGSLTEPGTVQHSCDRCNQQPRTAPPLTKAAIKGMKTASLRIPGLAAAVTEKLTAAQQKERLLQISNGGGYRLTHPAATVVVALAATAVVATAALVVGAAAAAPPLADAPPPASSLTGQRNEGDAGGAAVRWWPPSSCSHHLCNPSPALPPPPESAGKGAEATGMPTPGVAALAAAPACRNNKRDAAALYSEGVGGGGPIARMPAPACWAGQ